MCPPTSVPSALESTACSSAVCAAALCMPSVCTLQDLSSWGTVFVMESSRPISPTNTHVQALHKLGLLKRVQQSKASYSIFIYGSINCT